MSKLKIECKARFGKSRRVCRARSEANVKPVERVPRIAKLMALAIRFDQLIRDGEVKDQAELARLGQVSRARVTQIMNLLNLAPEIQESLLYSTIDLAAERSLREVVREGLWTRQRESWRIDQLHLSARMAIVSDRRAHGCGRN